MRGSMFFRALKTVKTPKKTFTLKQIKLLQTFAENRRRGFCYFNPHLHERVSNHRDQKYIEEVSFWPAEYRNRPPKVPLIFNFKNFGEFQKFLIRPEMHYLDAFFFVLCS